MLDIVDRIFYSIFSFFWFVFITIPFKFLSVITQVFNFLSTPLINLLFFGKAAEQLKYSEIKIPIVFSAFLIINSIVFIGIFISVIIKLSFSKKNDKNVKILNLFKNIIPSILLVFLIPLLSFIVINIFNSIFNILIISFNSKTNIANNIFLALKPEDIQESIWTKLTNNNSYSVIDFETYKNLSVSSSQLLFFPAIVGISLIIIFIKSGINLANKTFQYFFLFLISPFIFSTILMDEGKKFLYWKRSFFSKLISIFVYLVILNIFSFYAISINSWITEVNSLNYFSKMFILTILLIGGAISCNKFLKYISILTNQEYKIKENIKETNSVLKEIKNFIKNKEIIKSQNANLKNNKTELTKFISIEELNSKKISLQLDDIHLNKTYNDITTNLKGKNAST
ncbi:Mbov_0396 family ICE element transmembrane protein [Mycoplasma sp. 480]|uniref:Mbov_0396 family ICE element transmembrane protein n=1 Tax=Mycoplasma sp. 480 TaxID=3440155 RepID=UPI003F50E4DA